MRTDESRKYYAPGPGRLDKSGVEWFRTDEYPGWYRWETNHDGMRRRLVTDPSPSFPEE